MAGWDESDAAEFRKHNRRPVVLRPGSERGAGVVRYRSAGPADVFVLACENVAGAGVVVNVKQVGVIRMLPAIVVDHQARAVERASQIVERFEIVSLAALLEIRHAPALVDRNPN